MSHTRRGILIGAISALVATVLYKWPQPDPIDVLSKRLRALFPEIASAAPILHKMPEFAPFSGDRRALARSMFSTDPAIVAAQTTEETMDLLARAVDRDFADGRLVAVEGWTLSQTEARLLAFIGADKS